MRVLRGSLSLSLLRWWDHTQLLHQAHHVQLAPELHDLTADDPVEDATWHLNTLAGGRDALQLAPVRTPAGPPLGHPVPFRDQLLEGGMPVWERFAPPGCETFGLIRIDHFSDGDSGWREVPDRHLLTVDGDSASLRPL